MGLLDETYEPFVMMDQRSRRDSYGTLIREWVEGAQFDAAATFDTSLQARVAGVQGVTSLYTVTTPKGMTLNYHEVIKRLSDGLVLRVTSRGQDKKTPASAGLDMRQVTAEEYVLTG